MDNLNRESNAPAFPQHQAKPTPTVSTPEAGTNPVSVFLEDEGEPAQEVLVTQALADVLARSAQISRGNDEFDVSFSSLLIATLASDPSDPAVRYFRAYAEKFRSDMLLRKRNLGEDSVAELQSQALDRTRLASPLRRTISAAQAFKMAEMICSDASPEGSGLDTRHVLAAYTAITDYHTSDFLDFKIDRRAWARDLGAVFASSYPAEKKFWLTLAANPDLYSLPVPPFDADVSGEKDLLKINPEVRALAALIASHKTPLPLSIGLFGKWGSGKSFYMRQLQRRIEQIVKTARRSRGASAYFTEVVQIQFNAWQYNESNLWASLVDHILSNLRVLEEDKPGLLEQRRKEVIESMHRIEDKQATLDQQTQTLKAQIHSKEEDIRKKKAQQEERLKALAETLSFSALKDGLVRGIDLDPELKKSVVSLAAETGVPALVGDARELQATLLQARDEVTGWGALFTQLNRPGRRKMYYALWGVIVLAPLLLGGFVLWAKAHPGWVQQLAAFVVGAGAYVKVAQTWATKQLRFARGLREQIENRRLAVEAMIERQLAAARESSAKEIAEHLVGLNDLRAEEARLAREKDQLEKEKVQVSRKLDGLSAGFLLNEFLGERAASQDYVKHLGLVALIRRDFDRLSRLIEQSNQEWLNRQNGNGESSAAAPVQAKLPQIHRIVLYIDDLDRCSESVVVKVLQAVHLLLAFPAFVVVVGVDSRWLQSCLEKEIWAGLSDPDRAGTPLDYLEKIFQIPIWLPHLSDRQKQDMVSAFLRPSRKVSPGTAGMPGGADPGATRSAEPERNNHLQDQGEATPVQLNPPELDISERESKFIRELVPLLSDSPRVLKRFANTYRLLRAGLSPADQAGFADGTTDSFRMCMFQLAVLVCMRRFAADYLARLRSAPAELQFSQWLGSDSPQEQMKRSSPEWSVLGRLCAENDLVRDSSGSATVQQAREWAERAARYSFVAIESPAEASPLAAA
jgi:hypothetical protein